MKSIEMSVADAKEEIKTMSLDELAEFTEGDTRKGVLDAQESRITALSTEPAPTAAEVAFNHDRWIYREDEAPVILKAGTPVPEGWTTERGEVSANWQCDNQGNWRKA